MKIVCGDSVLRSRKRTSLQVEPVGHPVAFFEEMHSNQSTTYLLSKYLWPKSICFIGKSYPTWGF